MGARSFGVLMGLQVQALQETPLLDCFSNDQSLWFPEHLCCDAEQWPPTGWWKCWGGDFTYENCCGPPPECTEDLVSEVWKYVDPDGQETHRDFWNSNTFFEISRVRKEPMCKVPFIARSVLALAKLDWVEEWEVLQFPRRARDHKSYHLRSIVDALYMMIEDVPLEFLLKSGAWAEMILQRLYGHSKKLAYYLLPHGLALLPGRLPLSDAAMTSDDEDFQGLLRRRLNLKLPLPVDAASSYLELADASVFGRISAQLVLALDDGAHSGAAFVAKAQELLRSWVEKNDYSDLFFSHWPIFRLLLYLHRSMAGQAAARSTASTLSAAWDASREILVISCLPEPPALPGGWGHTVGCHGSWSELLKRRSRWVLLISSESNWTASAIGSVREGLTLAEDLPLSMAVGFPRVDRTGTWQWPVRRLDFEDATMVRYSSYPTGYAGSQGRCCRGDTTSGTRAYHWDTLASLFAQVDGQSQSPKTMKQLLHRLDLLSYWQHGAGRAAATCMVPPLVENDYAEASQVQRSELPKEWHGKLDGKKGAPGGPLFRLQDLGVPKDTGKVLVLYCGPLDLAQEIRAAQFLVSAFQDSLENCAQVLRRATLQPQARDAWILFLSPFAADGAAINVKFVQVLRSALHHSEDALAAGSLARGPEGPVQTAKSIKHGFYKLQYRPATSGMDGMEDACILGDASSGTRLYRPGVLPAMMAKTGTLDAATLLVELDLLAKLGGSSPSRRRRSSEGRPHPRGAAAPRFLTCSIQAGPVLREEDYLQSAQLSDRFSQRFQVEAVDYDGRILLAGKRVVVVGNDRNITGFNLAHIVADRRIATSLLYRRRIEDDFVKIVRWWTSLDPQRHFAAPKQGSLLTAMIRGGHVSMMPWDTDLELTLYSTGSNPVLGWCDDVVKLKARGSCVLQRLRDELQMQVAGGSSEFFSDWLYETHLTFAFRVNVDSVFDINFESYVPLFPIKIPMFGDTILRVSWPVWEHLFFEVFQGSFEKKVGTSGNIAASVKHCGLEHNACIPDCEEADGPCDFEFDDYFAHSRDPQGRLFPA